MSKRKFFTSIKVYTDVNDVIQGVPGTRGPVDQVGSRFNIPPTLNGSIC